MKNKNQPPKDPNREIRELIALMAKQNAEFHQLLVADRKQRAKERTEDRKALAADRKLRAKERAEDRKVLEEDRKQRAKECAEEKTRRAKVLAEEKARRAKELAEEKTRCAKELAEEKTRRAKERAEEKTQRAKKIAEDRAEKAQRAKELAEEKTQRAKERAEYKAQQSQETAQRAKDIAERKIRQANEAAYQKRVDAETASLRATVERTSVQLGGFGNICGGFAEDMFWHSIREQCRTDDGHYLLGGVHYDSIEHNVPKGLPSGPMENWVEIDLVLMNSNTIAFIEVKNKVRTKDLDDLLQRRYPRMRSGYPEYADTRLYLASMQISESMVQRALAKGISVLQLHGNVLTTQSAKQPRLQ